MKETNTWLIYVCKNTASRSLDFFQYKSGSFQFVPFPSLPQGVPISTKTTDGQTNYPTPAINTGV